MQCLAAHVMDDSTRNHAPVFTDPGIYDSFPDPQVYANAQQPPLASGKNNAMLGKTSVICLGSALLVCGVLSQAGAAVAFRFYSGLSEAGVGVWCGYMVSWEYQSINQSINQNVYSASSSSLFRSAPAPGQPEKNSLEKVVELRTGTGNNMSS